MRFRGFSLLMAVPDWRDVLGRFHKLELGARALLADSEVRAMMNAAPRDARRQFAPVYDRWTVLRTPSDPAAVGASIAALARQRNGPPGDVLCDLVLADDLETVIQVPAVNRSAEAVCEFLRNDATLIGPGDAGAHVNSINNFSYTTQILQDFVRGDGTLSLEQAIRGLTSEPARLHGLAGRGVLQAGAPGDVNVIDFERLRHARLEMRDDLPAGPTGTTTCRSGPWQR